jgi:hypothetical protein
MAGAPNGKRDYDLVFVPLQLSASFWHMGFRESFLISEKINVSNNSEKISGWSQQYTKYLVFVS